MSKNFSPGLTAFCLTAADAATAPRVRDHLAASLDHLRSALALTAPPLRGELRQAERLLDGLWLAACARARFPNSNTAAP
jgi:hypothetical protein